MGKLQRNKGARGERECVHAFSQNLGLKAERISQLEADGNRKGDVLVYLPNGEKWKVSVKVGKQCPVFNYKALSNEEDIAYLRADRKEPLVLMRFDKFVEIVGEYLFLDRKEQREYEK